MQKVVAGCNRVIRKTVRLSLLCEKHAGVVSEKRAGWFILKAALSH